MFDFIKRGSILVLLIPILLISCQAAHSQIIETGAEQSNEYLPLLSGKKVALVTNHSARIGDQHLVDFLLEQQVDVQLIFAPEHGFRGDHSDGAKIEDEKDAKTGISVLSVYGKNKKPKTEQLEGIDVIVFDIQDVGTRFYTFISTMSYVMEAAAENNIEMVVLDRPNPNAYFVDGPVLKKENSSFIGLHAVPPVYGMTIGEYAWMVKGEKWINQAEELNLHVIKLKNFTHDSLYQLPIAPSPNLPNMQSVYLYPSLCYLEASIVSVGRGTDKPFQQIGFPDYEKGMIEFKPRSIEGVSKYPKFEGELCKGIDLSTIPQEEIISKKQIDWSYVWMMYEALGKEKFYKSHSSFLRLIGSDSLKIALEEGWSIEQYQESYQSELNDFLKIREKYLLYP